MRDEQGHPYPDDRNNIVTTLARLQAGEDVDLEYWFEYASTSFCLWFFCHHDHDQHDVELWCYGPHRGSWDHLGDLDNDGYHAVGFLEGEPIREFILPIGEDKHKSALGVWEDCAHNMPNLIKIIHESDERLRDEGHVLAANRPEFV